MGNHVHFVLTPSTLDGLAKLFQRLHTWWAMMVNKITGRTGPVFEGRYFSTALDEAHFWAAMRYVELNPTRAGLVQRAADWVFSSAREHLGMVVKPLVKLAKEAIEHRRWGKQEWAEFLEEQDPESEHRLRRCLRGCRPCGAPEWVEALERQFGRRFAFRRPKVMTAMVT
jgi:putative transposase